jgi:hypothetical protein
MPERREQGEGRRYLPFYAYEPALATVVLVSGIALAVAIGIRVYPLLFRTADVTSTPGQQAPTKPPLSQEGPAGALPPPSTPYKQSPAQQSVQPTQRTPDPKAPSPVIENNSKK